MAAIELKLSGLDGVLDLLKSLPPAIVSSRGGPVKSALRKGAVVILKAAQANLQAQTSNATQSGKQESTGLLLQNLIVTRGKPPAEGNGERYLVRVKRKTYPRKGGASVSTLKTAQLLEYGSSQQPAEPWLRPAFQATSEAAIKTIEAELIAGVNRAVAKASKGN